MENLWRPKGIEEAIKGKSYEQNQCGMSGAQIYILEDMVLKIQAASEETENEARILQWLNERIPVPEMVESVTVDGTTYRLMTRVPGRMLCSDMYMKRPELLVDIAAEAMELLWSVDIADCPCDQSLATKLRAVGDRVEKGLVDMDNTEPETFGKNGFACPKELLRWLEENRPSEERVFSHGDFCLPNLFADGIRITGFLDLGRAGAADKWQDIAICYRSLKNNFEGRYDGIARKGYDPDMLFQRLGIKEDRDRLRYYILLDELF